MNTRHHDQTSGVQASFAKDVRSFVSAFEDLGNPFEEESTDLLVLDTKAIADLTAVKTVQNVKKIGQGQFKGFTNECLVERSKSIDDVIHRNKLKVFTSSAKKNVSKEKLQMAPLKSDVGLFSQLYIGCHTREGNLEEFFCHENQAYPPSLSDGKDLYLSTKSDLLTCFNDLSEAQSEAPAASSLVLDGAAIVQMLKPESAKNFKEYASQISIPYIFSQIHNVSRVDLVWDCYKEDSLKGTARAKRGKGVRRRVVAGATIPESWKTSFVWIVTRLICLTSCLMLCLSRSTKRTSSLLLLRENQF